MCTECADTVLISPSAQCVYVGTEFTCSQIDADGHPDPPSYSWTNADTGATSTGATYTVQETALWTNLKCTANYTHDACPVYYAACHRDISVRVFSQ